MSPQLQPKTLPSDEHQFLAAVLDTVGALVVVLDHQGRVVFDQLTSGSFPNRCENAWCTRQGEERLVAWANTAMLDAAGDQDLHIGVSIGIALYPAHGENAQFLMKHADNAMYLAKKGGRNAYRVFNMDSPLG